MMASANTTGSRDANGTPPIAKGHVKNVNAERLLAKLDELEQLKATVSETLLDVVERRIKYPAVISDYVAQSVRVSNVRAEKAELKWATKNSDLKDVGKELELISRIKEIEKENGAFLHRLEECKRRNEEATLEMKVNEDAIRRKIF